MFSSEFPIKLPNDLSCYIHVFYKGRLPKKNSTMAEEILAHFDHYNLLNKEESIVQIWYESTISSQFLDSMVDLLNNA